MAELNEYLPYAGPQRRDRALHTLIGILRGVCADGIVSESERRELRDWLTMNARLAQKCAGFDELVRVTEAALAGGEFTSEVQHDLLALCGRLESHSEYYDGLTHVIQQLHGALHGIIADGVVSETEASELLGWLADYDGFRTVWPITEVESILVSVLSDRVITPEEQSELIEFFSRFADVSSESPIAVERDNAAKKMTVRGICAADPVVVVPGRSFCFTGQSRRATRADCHRAVQERGGRCVENVSGELDYLVICADGNPCWTYACYGRKVEEAIRRRENGQPLMLIRESDFWDALR